MLKLDVGHKEGVSMNSLVDLNRTQDLISVCLFAYKASFKCDV